MFPSAPSTEDVGSNEHLAYRIKINLECYAHFTGDI